MPRWARHFGVLIIACSLGCTTTGARWNFPNILPAGASSWMQRKPALPHSDPEAEEQADEPLVAIRDPNAPIRHDPATRMLIEAELKDATPEERNEWLAFLGTVESEQVPYVLRARRIAEGRKNAPLIADTESASGKHADSPTATAASSQTIVNVSATSTEPVAGNAKSAETNTKPADGNATGKSRKFSSGWLWSHPNEAENADNSAPPAEKVDRSTFGLPLMAGGHNKSESQVAMASAESAAPPEVNPAFPPSAGLSSRLTPGSQFWEDEMQKLIALLEAETGTTPGRTLTSDEVRKQVALRMLYLIQNEPMKAQLVIPGIPAGEQEFWTSIFLGLAEHLDSSGAVDPAERATQTMAHLNAAASHLHETARLRLRHVAFSQEINGFGNYLEFPRNEFAPGQTVLVYAELRNFHSEPTENGYFRTRIKSTIEIYKVGASRQMVDRSSFDGTEDLCRALRTDYYHSYRIDLPTHLSPGRHALKLIVEDELTGKMATETLEFEVQ